MTEKINKNAAENNSRDLEELVRFLVEIKGSELTEEEWELIKSILFDESGGGSSPEAGLEIRQDVTDVVDKIIVLTTLKLNSEERAILLQSLRRAEEILSESGGPRVLPADPGDLTEADRLELERQGFTFKDKGQDK
jgi:hypothetical protein